ncbi:MAG: ABC transporter ATP-binding protein [Alphaproteobacteria bacterium]|nr:ABC transporter ATP-binding protein [Alphaproteobacteria bacterium]
MASIRLRKLTKKFGAFTAVAALDLMIHDKEFVALLGPSGCGKTTTMNMIAGIEQATEGEILFNDRDMRSLPPNKRDVGFVFQNYAIFTHMTVYDNLAFGLSVRKLARAEIDRRVRAMAALMRLEDRLEWPSAKLSVNELQKVAIGRSAITEPAIFLLDEPLSNLDAAFRAFMRTELKHLQDQFQQTMVYVTHDQIEAMSLADRIAVMNLGVLQQYDTPAEVYNRPRNVFVANFMGSPSMNFLPCRLRTEGSALGFDFGEAGTLAVGADLDLERRARAITLTEVLFGIRPEDIAVTSSDEAGGLRAVVSFVEPIGPRTIVHLTLGGKTVKVAKKKRFKVEIGAVVRLIPLVGKCHLFDAATGDAIGLG